MSGPTCQDREFMLQACELAKKCTPSPTAFSVGCVVVEDGASISTGYSRELEGNTHAEECALSKLGGRDLSKATVYTTMEPCSKRLSGKKSCLERILEAKVHRVVIGALEPSTFVVCEGLFKLRDAGIIAIVLEDMQRECLESNLHLLEQR